MAIIHSRYDAVAQKRLDSLQAAFDPQSCIFDWRSFGAQLFKNDQILVTNIYTLRGFTHIPITNPDFLLLLK